MADVLVTGGSGQIGRELARCRWPADVTPHFPARADLDLASPDSIRACLAARAWAGVINCAAWTAVDRAEAEPATAFLVNAQGPAWLAELSGKAGIPILHVSTDYVFDGTGNGHRAEDDPVNPINAYGCSKLAGELAIRAGNPRSVILRTAWLQSPHGANFLKTMLRLRDAGGPLRVVDDQFGNPTAAADVAQALVAMMARMLRDPAAPKGTYHFVNAGRASWFELATALFQVAGPAPADFAAIRSENYSTPAPRPRDSSLSTLKITTDYGITPRPWRPAMIEIAEELARTGPKT